MPASQERPSQPEKSIEERYHQTQARFRTIFEESKLANKILARDLIIRQVNPALVALLGYSEKTSSAPASWITPIATT